MRPPLNGPLLITQLFGGNPKSEAYVTADGHKVIGHSGIDISAQLGEDVYPFADGTLHIYVSRANGSLIGFGLHAVVTDARGREVLYGHLNAVIGQDGDKVYAHKPFAQAGSSGFSTGPHVHLQLWEHGQADPRTDHDNGYDGCRDPLGGFDHDVVFELGLTNV